MVKYKHLYNFYPVLFECRRLSTIYESSTSVFNIEHLKAKFKVVFHC